MRDIKLFQIALFLFMLLATTGCELIGDIFEAGVWVGIFIVVAVVVLILWLIKKMF